MPPLGRWTRVKALLLEALKYPDADQSAFVAQASAGDAELMQELNSLLASEKAAASFCESPAAGLIGAAVLPGPDTASRLPSGTRLGAYEITGFIAAGGMGAVYRARHTLLGREVAIKTIGQELADDAARRRLVREAQHASVLTHPNICAIHDVGEADGVPFIVMEYVNGRTLGEIIREAVPLLRDALEYGAQIAGALEHAHERGIIHRDLKSSNVVIDAKGEAIVLDFGLARRLPDDAGVQLGEPTVTRPGALAGTLSHMAPEVLRGERADIRSDVWALGVLLYELVTGVLPFKGRTPFETSSAILGEAPRPMNVHVPLALRLVIERCLVKDPAGRYQRAQQVADGLDAIQRRRAWPVVGRLLISARRRTLYAAAAAALLLPLLVVTGRRVRAEFGATFSKRISTLALLPLENATGDPGADYYAEGVTDALIAQLGAASDIRVFSRASAARAAHTAKTVTDIGAQLGADVIVQGALRRSAEQIMIDVRLVRPSDGAIAMKGSNQLDANGEGASHNFILGDLTKILKNIEQSTLGTDSADDFVNLFEDLDLDSSKLGKTAKEKNDLVAKVLVHLDKIDFNLSDATADVLGDAYEYLIGEFASGAGKKAGEFYTPQPVSTLLAKLVTANNKNLKASTTLLVVVAHYYYV